MAKSAAELTIHPMKANRSYAILVAVLSTAEGYLRSFTARAAHSFRAQPVLKLSRHNLVLRSAAYEIHALYPTVTVRLAGCRLA